MTLRYHDEDRSPADIALGIVTGAVAGFAVGIAVAQRFGGFAGIASRFRRRAAELGESVHRRFEEEEEQYQVDGEAEAELEERVLEAFENDPTLGERAVDIGALGEGVIELSGWVHTDDESEHAVTIARGVPGVETVVNRLTVGEDEERFEENARRVEEGDPALTESRWEGQRVGTGRRRQGNSEEPDRHADPRPKLESKWLDEKEALRNAAEETEGIAERRRTTKKAGRGERGSSAAAAPGGVPKGDHVAQPADAEMRAGEPEDRTRGD